MLLFAGSVKSSNVSCVISFSSVVLTPISLMLLAVVVSNVPVNRSSWLLVSTVLFILVVVLILFRLVSFLFAIPPPSPIAISLM